MRRVGSSSSLCLSNNGFTGIGSVYTTVWKAINTLANDSFSDVATMAQSVIDEVRKNIVPITECHRQNLEPSFSEPSSPSAHPSFSMSGDSPPSCSHSSTTPRNNVRSVSENSGGKLPTPHHTLHSVFTRKRTLFGREPSITEDETIDDSSSASRSPLVSTAFVNWCAKHFCVPVLKLKVEDHESDSYKQKEWRTLRNNEIRTTAKSALRMIDPSRVDDRIFQQRNVNVPRLLTFHPYDPHLIVSEKNSFSVWSWDNPVDYRIVSSPYPALLGCHMNHSSTSNSRISSAHLVNPHDLSLLMIGSDDGSIKVWKDYNVEKSHPKLVTAFQVFGDTVVTKKDIISHWEQESCQLFAAGEPRVIRIWDSCRELKVQDMNTGADCSITSLSSDDEHLVCAGCQDGSIRIFDKRLNSNECRVLTFREHTRKIVKAHIFPGHEKHVSVISGSEDGDVRFWDKRILSSVKHMKIGNDLTSMDVHSDADVFAW